MAGPNLTYGGFPLLTDVGQTAADFLDKHQSLEDLRDVAPSVSRISSRADGLPFPNYPLPPKLRPNQLYWPTGASRWSIGYFFANEQAKSSIEQAAHSAQNTALELRVVTNNEFKANMFLLPPRRISGFENSLACWLIPLVDERYFWQFQDVGEFTVQAESPGQTTWQDVFTNFETNIASLSIGGDTGSVDSAYLIPDPEELTRHYDNAAVLLDAVCHSVGQRLVRWPDGTVKSLNWSSSSSQLATNIDSKGPWQQIAGGVIDYGPVPAQVNVSTRRFVDHVAIPRRTHVYLKSPTSSAATTLSTFKHIHTTAYADFTAPPSATPGNNTKLDALAAQIATDFYASTENLYDRTFAGIKPWDTSGYDDHVLYQFGGEHPKQKLSASTVVRGSTASTTINTEYDKWAHTRVQSSPINFGVEQQLSQDPDLRPLKPTQFGQLIEILEVDGIATFQTFEYDDIDDRSSPNQGHTTTGIELEVWDFFELEMPDATRGQAIFDFESERWYLLKGNPVGHIFTAATTGTWVSDSSVDTVPILHESSPLNVNLPKVGIGTGKPGKDPNLATGDVIAYTFTQDGTTAYCVSGYSDDPIGAVKIWPLSSTIPFGWRDIGWEGLLPVGFVVSGAAPTAGDPDLRVIGATQSGTTQHTHTEAGATAGHLDHTDAIDPTPGLGHDNLSHTGDKTGSLNGLGHPNIPHEDDPLVHATGSGTPNHLTAGTDAISDHSLTDHLFSNTDNDHNVDAHDLSATDHTIDDHIIPNEPHWPSQIPIVFIERFHE